MRIGSGYDVHRFDKDRKLILGGVEIPFEMGLLGHSDADVLLHAIMDSILGAAGLGDIGRHFPDSDEKYKGISSLELLNQVWGLLDEEGYCIINVDATIVAQKPKLAPYLIQMRDLIARALRVSPNQINIKATTEEGLGFTGNMEGISANAVCLIENK
ncbi:MAG: 2-C-methyl-D-erythritol 2,4-cyclodiphosphate synthase [Clostridiales bacterium]|nr:2-C-methyl-D-erythritol 2,4-cyclodiphosphate synthase [Clostridiales bacterium]